MQLDGAQTFQSVRLRKLMIQFLTRLSIGRRITLLSLASAFMATALILHYFPSQFSESRYSNKDASDHALMQVLTQLSIAAIAVDDTTILNAIFRSAEESADLAFAILIDADGHMRFRHDPAGILGEHKPIKVFDGALGYSRLGNVDLHVIEPVPCNSEYTQGRMIVGTYLDQTHDQVASTKLAVFTVAGIFLCIGVLIAFGLGRLTTKPLGLFVDAAEKVAEGNYDIGELATVTPELNVLGDAFQKMASQIKQQMIDIRESENRYRSVVEYGGNGILVLCKNQIVFANAMVSKIIGYEDHEFSRQNPLNHIHPDDRRAVIRSMYKPNRENTTPITWECRVIDKEGEIRWIKGTGASIGWDGKAAALVFISDITTKKRDEDALRFTRHSIDRISDSAFWVDSAGRLAHFNQAAGDLVGRNRDEMKDLRFYDLDQHLTRSTWQQLWEKAVLQGHFSFESDFVTPKGHDLPVEVSVNYLKFNDSEYSFIMVRDITERKLSENRLQEHLHFLQTLMDTIPDPIFYLSSDRKFLGCNSAFEEALGKERSAIIGSKTIQVYGPETGDLIHASDRSVLASGKTKRIELSLAQASGELREFALHEAAFRDADGNIAGLVGVMNDITDRKNMEQALRESEERHRSIVENAGDSIALIDMESLSFVEFNGRAHEDLGYSRNEFSSLTLADVINEFSPTQIRERLESAISGDVIERFEAQAVTAQGEIRDLQLTMRHLVISNRQYFSTIWQDVTDRKNWETKLQQLAEYPRGNPNMVLSMTGEGQLIFNNPAVESTLKSLDLTLDQMWQILPDNFLEMIRGCLDSGESSIPIESRFGNRSWLWMIAPVKGQSVIHVHAIDISDRIDSEEQMRKLSAAVQQSHNTVIITDTTGLIEYANPQFQEVSGMTLDEVKKLEVSIVKSGIEGPREYQRIWEAIEIDRFWTGNLKNRTISGGYYWAREVVSPIFDKDAEIIGYLFIGQDITKEIEMQQKVIESDKLSAIGMLAAGVAHEFKNYLGGIIGNASFALDDIDSENGLDLARETLEQIISLGERANDVAMSLLTYSRAKPEEVGSENLKPIIDKSISLVEKEMSNLNIELAFYHEDVPPVNVSASKIQQLLLNLLINAQHAIKKHGVITIALIRDGDSIQIKVGDSGSGIAQSNLVRVFDPFFSTKGVWGKDEVIGTGMGLAICRNIAREHDGDLTAKSIVGMGTTFTLSLPVSDEFCSGEAQEKSDCERNVFLFSLDNAIAANYFKQGIPLNISIQLVDNIDQIPQNLAQNCDFVICDARFTGKVELYKTGEICRRTHVPYVMINCGSMEYQLSDLYDSAAACFKETAALKRILETTLETNPISE